jgi:hypothetical protein
MLSELRERPLGSAEEERLRAEKYAALADYYREQKGAGSAPDSIWDRDVRALACALIAAIHSDTVGPTAVVGYRATQEANIIAGERHLRLEKFGVDK